MTIFDLSMASSLVLPPDGELPVATHTVSPEASSTTGCVDPRVVPTYIVPSMMGSSLTWTLKDQAGNVIQPVDDGSPSGSDLTDLYSRMVLFHNPFCSYKVYVGRLSRITTGFRIYLPDEVANEPGLYQAELHWREGDVGSEDEVQYLNTAYLSVEQTLAQRATGVAVRGPIPLSRIRQRIRDFATANDVTGYPEFSVEEIVTAILEPIECYNEALPHIHTFTPYDFPYRQQWVDATVARLLQTAGYWMMRNDTPIQAEGAAANERAKYQIVLKIAQDLWDRYNQFVKQDKVQKNMYGTFRIV